LIRQVSTPIKIPYEDIQAFCQQWQITEFALFGSIVTDTFQEESDVDVLIRFDETVRISLFQMVELSEELEEIFGRKVDVLTRRSIEQSDNFIRKENILQSMQVIYAA